MTTPPTVLVVDGHELIRLGLRLAFEQGGGLVLAGEAASSGEALSLIDAVDPDVCVIEVRLPDGDGLDLVRSLRRDRPTIGLVVLAAEASDDYLLGALDAGASAFVTKRAPSDDVIAAIRHAASQPTSFVAADLAAALHRRLNPVGPQLTPREREVLSLLADGLSVSAIARKLYISESTTKTHVSKLYDKLGAANRAQALMSAMRAGLLESVS